MFGYDCVTGVCSMSYPHNVVTQIMSFFWFKCGHAREARSLKGFQLVLHVCSDRTIIVSKK